MKQTNNAPLYSNNKNLTVKKNIYSTLWLTMMLTLLIISFQIRWTVVFQSSALELNSSALGFNITDLLLPVIFASFFFTSSRQGYISTLNMLRWPLWFVVFTTWIGISILISCKELGFYSSSVFIRKFFNWFVLVVYFYLGNLIEKNNPKFINQILKILFLSTSIISIFSLCIYIFFRSGNPFPFGVNGNGNLVGFFGDPVAFGLFTALAIILQLPLLINKKLFPMSLHYFCILPNLTAILLSGSRTAMIALIVGIISYIMHNALNLKKIFILLFASIVIVSFMDFQKLNNSFYNKVTQYYTFEHSAEDRLQSMTLALNWWIQKPLTGIGVGGFSEKQVQQSVNTDKIKIYNTPILLLTEIGLIGILLYGCFLLNGRNIVASRIKEGNANLLTYGMLMIFPAYIVASVTTEIFYQRYLWFFLGLALAKTKLIYENSKYLQETYTTKIANVLRSLQSSNFNIFNK